MKIKIKAIVTAIILAMSFMLLTACGGVNAVNRKDGAVCYKYYFMTSLHRAVRMKVTFECCEILATAKYSQGALYIESRSVTNDDELSVHEELDLPHYSDGKIIISGDPAAVFKDKAFVEWEPKAGFFYHDYYQQPASDYVAFIAKRDGHFVGYAVFYVYYDPVSGTGNGGAIANVEFPQKRNGEYQNIDQSYVEKQIEKAISKHPAKK